MKNIALLLGLLLGLLVAAQPVLAERPEAIIAAKLKMARPGLEIDRVVPSEAPGLYRVELGGEYGQQHLHTTADGAFMIVGDLFAVEGAALTNISENARQGTRKALLAKTPVSDMAVFSPKGKTRAVVTVFTDVDCGYCQKLHAEMAEYNARGIEVRYLAYPRQGLESDAYRKMVSAWCADDRNEAVTRLKARRPVPEKNCDNPVARQYALGQQIGINGTPAILLETGELLPGYVPAAELEKQLGL